MLLVKEELQLIPFKQQVGTFMPIQKELFRTLFESLDGQVRCPGKFPLRKHTVLADVYECADSDGLGPFVIASNNQVLATVISQTDLHER